jgi:AraC family transcriptional regulator of adaptative response/methylated-DNA-[protein]-cysteine methyltransferase
MNALEAFQLLELRLGRIIRAERHEEARKPAYRLWIDFGPAGVKASSAQLTDLYRSEQLVGRLVVAAMNLGTRRIAGFTSEVLVLGVPDAEGRVVLLATEREVPVGGKVSSREACGQEVQRKNRIDFPLGLPYCRGGGMAMGADRHGSISAQNGTGDRYWQALLARDPAADDTFVYAVRSTGIYCRPSCASRKPRRGQVVFFPHPEAAERSGFRPCRRCRPRDTTGKDSRVAIVERACQYIDKNREDQVSLAELGAQVGLSAGRLRRIFTRVMGITPRQYADARRLDLLKGRLREGETVTRALYDAGFGSSSRLYERAPGHLGMTPATYRRGGQGMQIEYTTAGGPLGLLLVAATERGVCAVYMGDSDRALEAALSKEYPAAEISRGGGTIDRWVGALLRHLEGQQPHLDLPLDVQATAFQRRVWEELRAIPYGSTRSYGEIAERLGQPRAARAVGRACATNPVSLVVPCHRAVRDDGGLGGYRWGVERKQRLLALERGTRGVARSRRDAV